jgi:uncharacterized protein (TIGR00369 family)
VEIAQKALDQLNDNSLYHTLGIRVEEAGDGAARSRLAPEQKVCWPFPGQPHGGVLFTFMDTTMAWAVFSEVIPDYNCATIGLDIQYTRPAKGKLFTCSAQVIQRTGRTSFARAEIRDEEDRLLALGQGTFRIIESDIMREALAG